MDVKTISDITSLPISNVMQLEIRINNSLEITYTNLKMNFKLRLVLNLFDSLKNPQLIWGFLLWKVG